MKQQDGNRFAGNPPFPGVCCIGRAHAPTDVKKNEDSSRSNVVLRILCLYGLTIDENTKILSAQVSDNVALAVEYIHRQPVWLIRINLCARDA